MSYEEMDFTDAGMLRRKAEEKLRERKEKGFVDGEETDVKKLLYELQVQKIELEMQNEALRKAYETLETALKKYIIVFELSLIGYFTLDEYGTIRELNFTGAEMLGERRFRLINSDFNLYVSNGSKLIFKNFFKKVYSGRSKESCEVLLGNHDKPLCFVYMEGVVTENDGKCLLSVVDISKFSRKNKSQNLY